MTRRRQPRAPWLAGAALGVLALTAAGAEGDAPGRPALAVQASAWTFPGRPLAITVDQAGVLASRRLAVYLFVDGNQFARITTQSDRTRTTVLLPELLPGQHELTIRSGTEAATTGFRILPWEWLIGAAVGLLAIGLLILFGRRLRRLPPSG